LSIGIKKGKEWGYKSKGRGDKVKTKGRRRKIDNC
jgi:hypothetical protein